MRLRSWIGCELIRRNARLRGDAVTRRTLLTGAAAGAVIAAGGNAFAKQTGDCDRLRSVLIGHRSIVSSAAFSPDARQIVTASYDTTARLWNAATGAGLNVLNGHTDAVYSASFSPDGKQIVTASIDGTARLWDALGGSVKVLLEGRSIVRDAAFSADGRWLATISDDNLARIWDARAGEALLDPRGPHRRPDLRGFQRRRPPDRDDLL